MIEELAVTHIVEKKEQPKPDIYIVLWQGNNQLGSGDNSFDNERDIIPLDIIPLDGTGQRRRRSLGTTPLTTEGTSTKTL